MVQNRITFKEGYSQRQIAKNLKNCRHEVQYLLQWQLETGTNFDKKKRDEALKVITATKGKYLIIEIKRYGRKIALVLTVELDSFW